MSDAREADPCLVFTERNKAMAWHHYGTAERPSRSDWVKAALSAVLTDLGRELVDDQAEAAELANGLARALGPQPCA